MENRDSESEVFGVANDAVSQMWLDRAVTAIVVFVVLSFILVVEKLTKWDPSQIVVAVAISQFLLFLYATSRYMAAKSRQYSSVTSERE